MKITIIDDVINLRNTLRPINERNRKNINWSKINIQKILNQLSISPKQNIIEDPINEIKMALNVEFGEFLVIKKYSGIRLKFDFVYRNYF